MSDIEKRTFACELRAGDQGEECRKISGYGAVFNTRSENLGGFREVIMPGAFDDVLQDDVRALFNHDPNYVLGRTSSGTLSLRTDETGLGYDIEIPDNQTIRDLVIAPMQRGDISQSSFAFIAGDDDWDEDEDGVIVRTIHRMKRLIDVSPVTYPAYTDATAATRSLQQWQEARNQGLARKAINQRQARVRMLELLGASI
ncbi:HK97 family phage prohead protease [Endozoicomonas sp. ISHI1]|uniref:HK97 family phage prohead protease n=1 Tax=Endozoicomonas sp. ISHI1 TaxID=2825882 RepID=UPI0021474C58|nr:HK97 family phage prohead protease [Endozoicomonas sp. ISHI1]